MLRGMFRNAAVSRETYHHLDLKAAALDLAEKLIESEPEFSLRSLAVELGVAHRALYNHFQDRSGLLALLSAKGFCKLAAVVDVQTNTAEFVRAYASFALCQPQLYSLMMRQTYELFAKHTELRIAADRMIDAALAVLAPDRADDETGRRAVMRIWMLVHGGLALHAGGALRTRSDEAFISELLAIAGLVTGDN